MRKTQMLTLSALFTALCAVCAQIQIPLQPVQINLALLAVHLAAAMLPPRYAAFSLGAYLMLGAMGLPVLTGFRGGIGVLLDRTGGYMLSYLPCALLESWLMHRGNVKRLRMCLTMALGTLLCYAAGTAWFMLLTATPLWTSLTLCVLPFIPGDAVKVALAAGIALRMRKIYRGG